MNALFTVLLPINRPPVMLSMAVESVLAQTVSDFQLAIICDGAPEESVRAAQGFAEKDRRVSVHVFEKGERHGEAHRATALAETVSRFVAHIADDDLWLPWHLEELAKLLRDVDFGNLPQIGCRPDGSVNFMLEDLADPAIRERMCNNRYNIFGPTFCGYRREAYDSLAEGWSPAPPDLPTDLFMWRKFLVRDDLRFGTRFTVSGFHFAASTRSDMSLGERQREVGRVAEAVSDPVARDKLVQQVLRNVARRKVDLRARVHQLNDRVSELREKLSDLRTRAKEAKTAHDRQAREIDRQTRELERLTREIVEAHAVSERRAEELEGANARAANLASELQAMRRTVSWRITGPLRAVRRGLGGLSRRDA
jgi:hypothetical protein